MANPTNINVPPAKGADPTNVNAPVHGTKYPSGVTGADQVFNFSQGTDLGAGLTNSVIHAFVAPCDGYFRKGSHFATTVTATATFDILNNTTSTSILGTTTPVAATATAFSTFASAAAQSFSEGDTIQIRVTTNGSGALKGLSVDVFWTPLAGTTTNPV